jgi:hypothetical protein
LFIETNKCFVLASKLCYPDSINRSHTSGDAPCLVHFLFAQLRTLVFVGAHGVRPKIRALSNNFVVCDKALSTYYSTGRRANRGEAT